MQKIGIGMVALALVLAYAPFAAAENTNLTSRFDTSKMTAVQVPINVNGEYTITVDHATGAITVLEGNQASGAAGCISVGVGGIWSTNPVGISLVGCAHQFHTSAIESTSLACVTFSFCLIDGINFDFLNFGLLQIFCTPLGAATQSWVGGPSGGAATCFVFFFGSNPSTWNIGFWDSIATGSLPGLTIGTHALV